VYAESLGSFALIPSLILEYRDDEGPLKLPHCFRAWHAGFIHLQHQILQMILHGDILPFRVHGIFIVPERLRKGYLSEEYLREERKRP